MRLNGLSGRWRKWYRLAVFLDESGEGQWEWAAAGDRMRLAVFRSGLGLVLAIAASYALAEGLGQAVDLSSFSPMESDPVSSDGLADLPLGSAVDGFSSLSSRRFYLSGIVGASFATLTKPALGDTPAITNQSLFTGGAAAGVAFDRPSGWLRFEFEGRGRETIQLFDTEPVIGTLKTSASDGWSAMANIWRDYAVADRLGLYAGGGIGAGGYRGSLDGDLALGATVAGSTGISSFAWQAGGGVCYAITDRVTLDLGYRFFSLGPGQTKIFVTTGAGTITDTFDTQFSTSELLFSIRVFEPFRNWR